MSTIETLAHQGGWDETLMIVGPLAAIIGLIALAKRKINRERKDASETVEGADVADGSDGSTGAEEQEVNALTSA